MDNSNFLAETTDVRKVMDNNIEQKRKDVEGYKQEIQKNQINIVKLKQKM